MRQDLRNMARWAVAAGAAGLGAPARYARSRRGDGRWGVILRYHRVIPREEPWSCYRIGVSEDLFLRQMEWLARHRRVVSFEEMLWWRGSGRIPGEDLVALTFDDGYLDNLTHAAPVLSRLGIPALFYVSASCLHERMPFWPEILAAAIRITSKPSLSAPAEGGSGAEPARWNLESEPGRDSGGRQLIQRLRTLPADRIAQAVERILGDLGVSREAALAATPPVMKAEHLRSLASMGFALGSHTVSHPYLPAESPEVQGEEIGASRKILEEAAGVAVLDFCYPGGGFDETTVGLVRQAGYRSATTTRSGVLGERHDPLRLPRLGVGQALASGPGGRFSAALMDAEISGWLLHALRQRRGSPPA